MDIDHKDSFLNAVATCRGELCLALVTTWVSLIINGAFAVLAVISVAVLLRRPVIVRAPSALLVSKLGSGTALLAFNITASTMILVQPGRFMGCSLASAVLSIVANCLALVLSISAHFKSHRPSTLLCSFLFLMLLANTAKCQELWRASVDVHSQRLTAIFTAAIAVQSLFLGVNMKWQPRWLDWDPADHSPEETSSILSLGIYSWMNRLLLRGYRSGLALDDLYPLDKAISANPLARPVQQITKSETRQSIWTILQWATKPVIGPILLPVLPRLCLLGFTFCQPLYIQRLLDFLADNNADTSNTTGTGLVGAAILIYFGIAVSTALYWYYQERAQSILRAFLVTAIYQKTARMPANDDMAAITLMSTDVDRVYTGMRNIHDIWANIIQTALASWLLQRQLGLAFLAPLILVILGFTSSFALSKYAVKYQRNWMSYIEQRISATSFVLANIKEYRISGLINPVKELVQRKRAQEIEQGAKSRSVVATSATLSFVPQAVAPVVAFAFGPHILDNTKAFTALSYISLLTAPLMVVLQTIPIITACMACLRRIYEFQSAPSRQDFRITRRQERPQPGEMIAIKSPEAAISVRAGHFGWEASDYTLKDVSLAIPYSSVTLVAGPVGSGKSTLCRALLGEVPHSSGEVMVNVLANKIGYCSQTPFFMNGTIMDNILGFSSFSSPRYEEVIHATMLQEDFSSLRLGDKTRIDSKGVPLSGGQRQRVSLARALYHDAELLVLDDTLTGLDVTTQEQICTKLFGEGGLVRRRKTTVILCVQAIPFTFMGDQAIHLGTNGTIAKIENLARPSPSQKRSARRAPIFQDPVKDDIEPLVQGNLQTSQPIKGGPSPAQSAKQDKPARKGSFPPTTTDRSVYKHYIETIGMIPLGIYLIFIAGAGFAATFPSVWLKFWSADSIKPSPTHSFAFYIGIFALIATLALICTLFGGIIVMHVFVRLSGTYLHQKALDSALHSSLSYLTATDTGTILNLFSQDMTIIDSQMPRMINNLCFSLATAIGQVIVIAISSGYLAISYPLLMAILYLTQKFYLPTSKQLRILDLETKSPLYTHFLDTLNGLATIRAFAWFPHLLDRNKELLDMSQRPIYLLAMAQQWLLLTMNVIVAVLTTILASLATQLQGVNSGSVGAGLVMLMTFGQTLTTVINAYTGLEISLGSISRLKTFNEITEREDKPSESILPDESWPPQGKILMKDVVASYSNNATEPVLSDITLIVQPREKVAVCGRTGSGKSSLVALLLRMLDPISVADTPTACIFVDGLSLDTIDRTTLRTRFLAVSQSATFLPEKSTFRENLDPEASATTGEIVAVLRVVGLHELVLQRRGLDAIVKANELSGGQQQLLALGRVILRRRARAQRMAAQGHPEGGILLLDEMTASVDRATENAMMEIIAAEFKAYTVLMVTHSMEVAMKCGRVLILDQGRIVEDGDPKLLVEEESSRFYALNTISSC